MDWKKLGLAATVVFIVLLIYHGWFSSKMIVRGDWKGWSSEGVLDHLGSPSIWIKMLSGGVSRLFGGRATTFPLWHLQAHLRKLFGLGFAWTERILWFFPFLLISTVSIYTLSRYLLKNILVSFFATIYFIANNFIVFRMHGAQMNLGMGYALIPLSLYFYIRGLKEKKLHHAVLSSIVLCLMTWYALRLVPLVIFVQLLYGLYYYFFLTSRERSGFLMVVKSIALAALFLLLSNIFWLLPLTQDFGAALPADPELSSLSTLKSLSRTGFLDTLALSIGSDSKRGGFIYLDGQIITAALLPVLLIIYGCSLLAKPRRDYMFWFLLAIVLAFFAKGLNPPLSGLNAFFYNHVPLAAMYRLPTKFLLVAGAPISICFGLGCAAILSRIKKNRGLYVAALAILVSLPVMILAPALFGPNSLKSMKGGSSFKPFVSETYYEYEDWLRNQEGNYRSIFLPGTPSYYFFSESSPVHTGSPSKSELRSFFKYKFGTLNGLKSLSEQVALNERVLPAALRLAGVRYIFLAPEDDTLWAWYLRGIRRYYADGLSGLGTLEKTVLPDVFQIDAPLPNIYLSRELVVVREGLEKFLDRLLDAPVELENLTLVDEGTVGVADLANLTGAGSLSDVRVKEVANAKYEITIVNPPEGRFYLNFLESYDPNWLVNNNLKASSSALGTNYFVLENDSEEPYLNLTLEHRLQKYLDLGWKASQVFWGAILIYLLLRWGRALLR